MEKIVKTKTEHKCGYCEKTIPKGTKAFYMDGKDPVYENDEYEAANGLDGKQVGIKYWKIWYCFDEDTDNWPACSGGVLINCN